MFQLLSPFWLIALVGLLVPVFIHLWHKKKPGVIQVGSIRWLQAAASQRVSRFRLQNLWLLLLRCLLLSFLVLCLCSPVWLNNKAGVPGKNVFVAPDLLAPASLKQIQSTVDSLIGQGYSLHTFTPSFSLITPSKWEAIKSGKEPMNVPAAPENYWFMATLLAKNFPDTADNIIFTPTELKYFRGSRPNLPRTFRWLTFPAAMPRLWVQAAFKINPDTLAVRLGTSSATGTHFKLVTMPLPQSGTALLQPELSSWQYLPGGGQEYLRSGSDSVRIKQTPPEITVFYDRSRQADAQYVQAALKAISSYTGQPISINLTTSPTTITPRSIWLFWLSDANWSAAVDQHLQAGMQLLKDAPAAPKLNQTTWFRPDFTPATIRIYQQQLSNSPSSFPIWTNNFGEKLLQRQSVGKGNIYYFGSRFNLAWAGLTENPLFPEIIYNLLFPEQTTGHFLPHDQRILSPEQAQPIFFVRYLLPARLSRQQPLQDWFWGMAALLFLFERIWSYRRATL